MRKTTDVDPLIEMTKINNELINVQRELAIKNAELKEMNLQNEKLLSEIKMLKSLIPICMHCKKLRDEADQWHDFEQYIRQNTDSDFSHGICDECFHTRY